MELLLPRTDGGVLVQFVVAALVLATALFFVRRHRDVCVLVAGLGLTLAGWFALRAVH